MFEVTEQARIEMAKRRKRARDQQDRDSGGTPLHAQAEGHREFHEKERKRREQALKTTRHPETGQFVADQRHPVLVDGHAADSPGNPAPTPRPATSWPGTDAHTANVQDAQLTQVGERVAPSPQSQTTLTTAEAPRVSGPGFAPGTAEVQHLDLTTSSPLRPHTSPVRPAPHTAPINTGSN